MSYPWSIAIPSNILGTLLFQLALIIHQPSSNKTKFCSIAKKLYRSLSKALINMSYPWITAIPSNILGTLLFELAFIIHQPSN